MRFKGFEGEWESKKLSDVAILSRGKSKHRPRDAEFLFGGKYPFVQTGDIKKADLFLTEFTQTYSEAGLKQSKLWNENTLCITIAANIAETAILKIKACFPDSIIGLIPKENQTMVLFVKHLFDKFKIEIQKLSQGVAQDNLNQEKLSKIEFSFPKIIEQDKICSFLSIIDFRIQTQSKIIEELELLKTTASAKIFIQKLNLKDNFGNTYPDWQTKSLGEIGQTYNGLTGKTKEDFGVGKPYIQYKQIFDQSKIDISRCELVTIHNNESQPKVKKGDIFFTISSETPEEIGMSSVLLDEVEEVYLNSFCFGYRSNSEEILLPSFARYLFRSDILRNEIIKLAQGSTRYNVSKIALMKLKIKLPSEEEQFQIGSFLTALDDKISIEQKLLEKLKKQKQYLLSNLFI